MDTNYQISTDGTSVDVVTRDRLSTFDVIAKLQELGEAQQQISDLFIANSVMKADLRASTEVADRVETVETWMSRSVDHTDGTVYGTYKDDNYLNVMLAALEYIKGGQGCGYYAKWNINFEEYHING